MWNVNISCLFVGVSRTVDAVCHGLFNLSTFDIAFGVIFCQLFQYAFLSILLFLATRYVIIISSYFNFRKSISSIVASSDVVFKVFFFLPYVNYSLYPDFPYRSCNKYSFSVFCLFSYWVCFTVLSFYFFRKGFSCNFFPLVEFCSSEQ